MLSGAAGLVDEVVWSRQLVLVFGNTTQAVATILTGFFGGMAIGSYLGGRLADRVRSPLRLYGVLEIVLVVVVILTPITFRLLHEAYRGRFPTSRRRRPLALVRFALALLALAPATVLMGATLPTLTRYLSGDQHLSRRSAGSTPPTRSARSSGPRGGLLLIELLGLSGRSPSARPARRSPGVAPRGRSPLVAAEVEGGMAARRPAREIRRAGPHRPGPRQPPSAPGLALPRVHLRPDVARLPGPLDPAPGVRHRQHDLRVQLILAIFLIGFASAPLFYLLRPRIGVRSGCSRSSQVGGRRSSSPA